jgi:hypothetical protein
VQLHYSARILLLLHSPSRGGMQGYMKRQRLLEKSVETICGITIYLTDNASSLMSSQCLFVGASIVHYYMTQRFLIYSAGSCTQDPRKRAAIVELIDICQQRTGWPTKSLSEDLRVEWEQLDQR